MGLLVALIYGALGVDYSDMNPLVVYVAQFIPPLVYVLYKAREVVNENGRLIEQGLFDRIQQPVEINRFNTGKVKGGVAVLLTVVATLSLMVVLEPLNMLVPMPESVKDVYREILDNMFWTSLSVAVAAPLLEEFFLRGIILRGMLYHATPLKSVLWSAFFFALIHLNLYQALGAFMIGLFMGWIYYRTGSLCLTVLIHFVNNGSSVLFTLLFPEVDIEATLMDVITEQWSIEAYVAVFAGAFLALGAIIWYFQKKLGYGEGKEIISA